MALRLALATAVQADRLADLAQLGLHFGQTYQLVKNCGDENPLLDLLREPSRLPEGKLRRLLPQSPPSVRFLSESLDELVARNEQLFELMTGFSHRCFVQADCPSTYDLARDFADVEHQYLTSTAMLVARAPQAAARGLRGSGAALARHGFEAQHLDFAHAVQTALESESFEAELSAASALHDLSLRRAQALCRLQAELLALTIFDLQGVPPPGLRFEFHPFCCRRYHVLAELLAELPRPARVLEVGVNNAITSEYLLNKFEDLEFDGVDPFLDAEPIFAEASARLRRPRARLWRLTSEAAAPRWPDGTFDLIFIDGDHSYAAVKQDLQLWRPKLRANGLLAGHDLFNLAFEGVFEALVDIVQNDTIHFSTDFVWWIQV